MLRRLLSTTPTWLTVPIRLALGSIMTAHGAQKVLGVWGGRGFTAFLSGTPPYWFMRPAWLWMGAAAFSEFFGGMMVFLGVFTRVGAFGIFCTMMTAAIGFHWGAFFSSEKGLEYPMALAAMALMLLISGGGNASVDLMIASPGGRKR